jgi:hypothetical protein
MPVRWTTGCLAWPVWRVGTARNGGGVPVETHPDALDDPSCLLRQCNRPSAQHGAMSVIARMAAHICYTEYPFCRQRDAVGAKRITMTERERPPQPLLLTHDVVHGYAGFHNAPSHCRIRIYQQDGRVPVVIATELADNPGTSITNLAEQLCAEVIRARFPARFEEEEPVIWIEHYQRTPEELRRHWPEFSRVTFHSRAPRRVTRAGRDQLQLGTPAWSHLPRTAVEALVGQPVAD